MKSKREMDKPLRDLIEIIHFTQNVSAKIRGVVDEAEIYRIVRQEFARSKRYTASILLLTDDGSELSIEESSVPSRQVKAGEKVAGTRLSGYKIDLKKSTIYSQVVREGKPVQTSVGGIIGELFPRPLALLISKTMGYEQRPCILTPLRRHGRIVGALSMSSIELAEHLIPSVENLAQHISNALELAEQNAERKRAEEALREHSERLEETVAERTAELTSANRQLRQEITERERAEGELRRRSEGLAALNVIGTALSRSPRLDEVLEGALDTVLEVMELEAGAIHLVDEKRQALTLGVARSVSPRVELSSGLAGQLGQSGDALLMDDILSQRGVTLKETSSAGIEALVSVPLRAKDVTLGVMELGTSRQRGFTDHDLQLLGTVGNEIGVAIENAMLVEEVRQRLEELNRLHRVGTDVISTLDLDQVLGSIVQTAQELIPTADKAMIHLLDDKSQLLVPRVPCDPESDPLTRASMSVGNGVAGLAWQEGRSIYVPDTGQDSRYLDLGSGLRSLLVAPLLIRDRVIGTLSVDSTQVDAFNPDDERKLTTLASQAAIAIENARLHEGIKTSEEKYRSMVEHASDAISLVDLNNWRLLEANPQTEHLTGYSSEELMNMTSSDLRYAQDESQEQGTLEDLLTSGSRSFEDLSIVRKDGYLVPVSVSISSVPYSRGTAAQVVLRDVSARKKMEQQLIHTEKLAALGRLAASLAHEINNPLQAVRSSISLLAKRPLDEDKRERYLGIADTEVKRLIQMVQRMLDFYRPSKERRELTDVSALLTDTLALAGKQLQHSDIRVSTDLAPNLPPIEAVPNYLKQVFINIILNAVEAMPEGGELAVRTALDEESDELVIAFSDTGIGIPADDLPYIFEPFYTTKDKGTGLGLPISYSIVERHRGRIEVESEEGTGTTFAVKLPLGGPRHA